MTVAGSLDEPPIIVHGSRSKAALLLVGCLAFVAAGLAFLGANPGPWEYFGIAFFGLGSLIALWQLVSPAILEISPEGFSWRVLGRRQARQWTDVEEFRVTGMTSTKMVGWNYVEGYPKRSRMRRLNADISGVEASLPSGWELDAAELAGLLNSAHVKWLATSTDAAATAPGWAHEVSPSTSSARSVFSNRMSQRGYWIWVAFIVSLSVAIGFAKGAGNSAGAGLLLPWIWAYRGRLHDIGRTAWWMLVPIGAPIIAGIALVFVTGAAPGSAKFLYVVLAADVLQAIPTIWIGLKKGDPEPNRFGPPPGPSVEAAFS